MCAYPLVDYNTLHTHKKSETSSHPLADQEPSAQSSGSNLTGIKRKADEIGRNAIPKNRKKREEVFVNCDSPPDIEEMKRIVRLCTASKRNSGHYEWTKIAATISRPDLIRSPDFVRKVFEKYKSCLQKCKKNSDLRFQRRLTEFPTLLSGFSNRKCSISSRSCSSRTSLIDFKKHASVTVPQVPCKMSLLDEQNLTGLDLLATVAAMLKRQK